jgi:hypothetical protein
MNCANYATDYEEERRRNHELRRKLQKYAERVALLEVHIAMNSQSAAKQLQQLDLPSSLITPSPTPTLTHEQPAVEDSHDTTEL